MCVGAALGMFSAFRNASRAIGQSLANAGPQGNLCPVSVIADDVTPLSERAPP